MQFIHSRGIMHRDLRSENVLLDERGWVRIGDLGSSRLVDLNVTQTKQAGTPLYIAPEIYDEEEYTTAVDVYSYGLIVYELLTGRPVFPPTIPPLVLMKKAASNERPELPASMSAPAKRLIKRCWSADPDMRPTFDEIVLSLNQIKFQLTPKVDMAKVAAFISAISPAE